MTVRCNRPGDIDQVHHTPPKNVAKKVRVLREDNLDHFGAGFCHLPFQALAEHDIVVAVVSIGTIQPCLLPKLLVAPAS